MDQVINGESFRFEDFHWTLTDYIQAIQKAGLQLVDADECAATPNISSEEERTWAAKRDTFPTYLVLVLKKP